MRRSCSNRLLGPSPIILKSIQRDRTKCSVFLASSQMVVLLTLDPYYGKVCPSGEPSDVSVPNASHPQVSLLLALTFRESLADPGLSNSIHQRDEIL